ncbi:helix-turn-helix domain-containing protein [Arenibacter sp. BSSL-BM3]|uniref:Helix-turn-helix domain-containing protein n=1 Tax=Arenibacter arenosicollis TaxID=2762274 RepID=A0ABR7QK20_9FLAO|nr:two-component regulator propeller domain-containing protein [Arenibacter arenosicollis]MBC8767312.1 helix-turn-helix domain-containing protein [Arenibacter arenosicollis]
MKILNVGWSQEYKFQHITTVDGLSHNEVRKIVKDNQGFLWFGTQNGLNRYDGYRFNVFKNITNDSKSIIGDKIYSLAVSDNKLWVGTITGLSIINTVTLDVIPTPNIHNSIGTNGVLQLFNDGSNKVWVSTENENFIIDAESLEVERVLKGYKIASVAKSLDNNYWVGTDKGLLRFQNNSNTIIKNYEIGSFNVYSLDEIFTNSYGEVWLTISDKIYRYQSERDRFIEVYSSKSLNAISEDKEGGIFFGSYGNGLLKYKRDTGIFGSLLANPENHLSISSNDIYDVYVDDENIIWVGTQEGLDYYDFSRHRFNSLVHLPENSNSLRSSFVQTIFQDTDGLFWIGTREGIDLVDFENGNSNPKITHMDMGSKGFDSLNSDYVTCIHKDSKERMWIATMSNGLYLIDEKRNIFRHFLQDNSVKTSIAASSVRSILEDHLGRMWFGTGGGLSLLIEHDEKNYSFENLGYSKLNTNSLPFNDIYSVFEDSQNRIWVGMNGGGLNLLQEKGGSKYFLRFNHNPSDPKSISNDEVFVIYEDLKKRVWFGTSAGGLNLLKEDGRSDINDGYYFQSYTESDGLSDNEVNAILEDHQGDLWIATNTGFSEFNVNMETFTNYSTYDGVLKGKFRKNAKWKTEDGTLFFGGASGINYFNPNSFRLNNLKPDPVFLDLLIDGKVIDIGQLLDDSVIINEPLNSGSVVRLPGNDNRFEIEFASLSFTSPFRNQYAFKLEGLDKDWRYTTGKDPSARYSRLKAGKYRFYLKAANNDGVWNENPIYLDILVRANFTDKNIVKIGIVFLLLLTLSFGVLAFKKFKSRGLTNKGNPKAKKSHKPIDPNLEGENIEKIKELNLLMETDKIYLDSELGLSQLAEKIEVSTNHLSMLLNDYIGKNFYDYINHYRVEEVKKRLKDPYYQKQTISSIGGDCGFNSKSAFNRIFKNLTGKTPSAYQNMSLD